MKTLRSHWIRTTVVAIGLAILHTWPLATAPATHSLNYNADVMLNEWIVAWIQHQLPRAPFDLFDANIFYPATGVLAYSEPLIVPALLGYPVALLDGSPVLVHNILLMAGLTLTMIGGYALACHWTGDRLASLVAAAAFAYNAQSLGRLEHLQAAHAYGLPLALLAADKLIGTGERRHALWLAVWMVAMAYTSGYLVVFACVALGVLVLARARECLSRPAQVLGGFLLAAVVTAGVVLPLYLPYRRVAIDHGMVRSLDNVTQFSASIDGYLASYSRIHEWLWDAGAERDFSNAYFPGMIVATLALIGITGVFGVERSAGAPATPSVQKLLWPSPSRRRIVVALLALSVVGCVLSLGTQTPVYGWLYAVFPPMTGIRAAGRFGVLFLLGVALLAGIGLARIRAHVTRPAGVALALTAFVLVSLEALRAPLTYDEFDGIPGIYSLLAREPGEVVVVEVPFYRLPQIHRNAEYVLHSTAHWRPLMNGYSGYTPGTYRDYVRDFWNFPDPAAVDAMRAAGATHLVVHPRRFESEAYAVMRQALANPALERIAVSSNNTTLFRIR